MPLSLEKLDLSGGYDLRFIWGYDHRHKFTGGIPTEWSSLTNLKMLNVAKCGLSGA